MADAPADIYISSLERRTLSPAELHFSFSRSSGPGGQNVNKTSTRVTLSFDVDASPSLTPAERDRLREVLGRRIGSDGVLRIHSSRHRTQRANRQASVERFVELLTAALAPRKPRRPTRVSAAAHRRRMHDKRRKAESKQRRGRVRGDDH